MNHPEKPADYESELSEFKACIFDSACGEPISWGFQLMKHLGEERFDALRNFGSLQYCGGHWFLITRMLSREEAIEKYGPVTEEKFGPKDGFKWIKFGDKQFFARHLRTLAS